MRERQRRGSARRRRAGAWLASAAVHALVLALLLRGTREAAPPETPPPIAIEITDAVPEPTAPTPVPNTPGQPPVRPPPRAAPRPARVPGGPAPSPPASPPPATAGPDAPVTGTAPPGRALDLSLGALSAGTRDRLGGPAPPEAAIGTTPHASRSLDELRVEQERREDAVANVARGRVDPVLFDYLRGATARFEDEATRIAERIQLGPRETLRTWSSGYRQRLQDIQRGAARAQDTSVDPNQDPGGKRPDVLGQYDEAAKQAEAGAEERRAEVCLGVAPGRDTTVTLRRSSGNAALDRLAVDSFTRSVALRPVPGDVRTGLACYELRVRAFRMPPLPTVACGFDNHGTFTCAWPLKKITSVVGHLISVDYTKPGEPPGGRSLLRRAR
jgi:hypothetical protein